MSETSTQLPGTPARVDSDRSLFLDRVVIFSGIAGAVVLVLMVAAAVAGMFTPSVVLAGCLVPSVVAGYMGARRHVQPTLRMPGFGATLAVGAVILVVVVLNVLFVSEQMSTRLDAGGYMTTARWLSGHGNLLMDGRTGPFVGLDWVNVDWNTFYDVRSDGLLYSMFLHALPAVLAAMRWVFGDGALFYTNTAIFAVAFSFVFLLVAQFVRDWIAALTVAISVVTVVAFYFARATFSEPLMLLMLVLGLLSFLIGMRTRAASVIAVAGLVIGATAIVRIDGWMLVGGFLIASGLLLASLSADNRWSPRSVVTIYGAPIVVGAVGLFDGLLRSPPYLAGRLDHVTSMMLFVLLSLAVAGRLAFGSFRQSPSLEAAAAATETHQDSLKKVAGWATLAFAGVFLFVRPIFFKTQGYLGEDIPRLLALEREDGTVGRTLYEMSLRWFTWYWGWIGVALVFAGVLAILWSRHPSPRWSRVWFIVLIVGPQLAVYIVRPSVLPFHPWAMRRFYGSALILIPLLMGIAFEWMVRSARGKAGLSRFARQFALVTIAVVAFAVPLYTSAPLLVFGTNAGLRASVSTMCATLPESAAVVVHGESITELGAAIRSFCDVPTVASNPDVGIVEVGVLANQISDRGYIPVVISGSDMVPPGWTVIGRDTTQLGLAEPTVLRPPARAVWFEFLWVAAVP